MPSGLGSWKPADFIDQWDKTAMRNCRADPKNRTGLIVPHDPDKSKILKGVKSSGLLGVPDEFTDFLDLELLIRESQR